MAKQIYYTLKRILEIIAQFYMLLGERSNGKSFSVKEKVLEDAYNNNEEFVYVRRWKEDIKSLSIEQYFDDLVCDGDGVEHVKRITNGEYSDIAVYRGAIYFANLDDELKKVRGKKIGYALALTSETHYKSMSYPRVMNMIFEEFITDKGYLPNEVQTLMSLVSTVFRRRQGRVFLIGNTLSRHCPYFNEWQLTHVLKMKQGDIEVYHQSTNQVDESGNPVTVTIAVEYCANNSNNSKMFFGKSSKMIVSGEWETRDYLHLERRLTTYKCLYTMYAEKGQLRFCIKLLFENNVPFIYIYPYTKGDFPDNARVVTERQSLKPLYSQSLLQFRTKYDNIIVGLLRERKVTVSDNLTGTDFFNAFKI